MYNFSPSAAKATGAHLPSRSHESLPPSSFFIKATTVSNSVIMSMHNRLFGRGSNATYDSASKTKPADGQQLSRATTAAVVAARSILLSGGSEEMALRTAKAAAFSVLCPNNSDNDSSSGRNSSYLRRRKLKHQAEIVASMALMTAAANVQNGKGAEWDTYNVLSLDRSAQSTRSHKSPYARNITTTSMDDPSALTGPTKKFASSVASHKTGPTVLSTGISSNACQSHSQTNYPYARNITTAHMDDPSAMTAPTKKIDPSVINGDSGQATSTQRNLSAAKDEHPLKLNTDRIATSKETEDSSNWFGNFTDSVNMAWNLMTCGGDCSSHIPSRDDQTLGTKMGMEISYSPKETQNTVSTVISAQDQKSPEGPSRSTGYNGYAGYSGYTPALGTEAQPEYTSFQDQRDDTSTFFSRNTDESSKSNPGESLVDRWSRSSESEHSSIEDSISHMMHTFSSQESDEIKVRSALRETMERVVERSRHRRSTVPLNDTEKDSVSYEVRHNQAPNVTEPEFSTRSRKIFTFFKRSAKKRLYEA